jgi:hypothetical protein
VSHKDDTGPLVINLFTDELVTIEDGRLLTQGPGRPKVELIPLSETVFFLKVADVRMIFEKNDEGEVFQAVIRQEVYTSDE